MNLAICPNCLQVYEAVSASTLGDARQEAAKRLTQCRTCSTSSLEFRPLSEVPLLLEVGMDYPPALVSWTEG